MLELSLLTPKDKTHLKQRCLGTRNAASLILLALLAHSFTLRLEEAKAVRVA